MGLKDLSRKQLEKKAVGLGVEFTAKTSDVRLRNGVRVAFKAMKGKPSKKGRSGVWVEVWPKEWSPDVREEYYAKIVGGPMPTDEKKAYAKLVAEIDRVAPTEEVPRLVGKTPDCFGIYFSDGLKSCMNDCPHMPLCKRIVELRPDLKKLAEGLDSAADDAEGVEVGDVEAAERTSKKVKKTAPAAKASKAEKVVKSDGPPVIVMTKSAAFFEIEDPDLAKIYKWMASRGERGFLESELVAKLGAWDDPEAFAAETVRFLLDSKGGRIGK